MSKWAEKRKELDGIKNDLPYDKTDKNDKSPPNNLHNTPFVPFVPFVSEETNIIDFLDAVEERAAIMEHDAPDQYKDRQEATAAAYEECRVIYLEGYKGE